MTEDRLQLSPLYATQLEAAYSLSTAAGWNQTREDWERVLMLANQSSFGGWIGSRLVATGALTRFGQGGWVGMLLVDEAHRRKGHGSMMFDLLITIAEEMGLLWIGLDATELGKPLYLKRGFRGIGTINRWRLSNSRQPPLMPGIGDCDGIELAVKLDREATAMDRFDLLLSLEIERNTECMVIKEGKETAGFGFLRPGRLGPYIGPIVARHSEVARGIISRLLEGCALREESPVFIDVPGGSEIEPWLRAEGFEIVRSWTRMIRGMAEGGKPEMVFGIAGPELG